APSKKPPKTTPPPPPPPPAQRARMFFCDVEFKRCVNSPATVGHLIPAIGLVVNLFNFDQGNQIEILLVKKNTNTVLFSTAPITSTGAALQKFRVTVAPGQFPKITMVILLRVNGQLIGIDPPPQITFT
ncbi:MAG TPA: hypothetical protein VGB19_12075, partial [Actinomycetota bacterium]